MADNKLNLPRITNAESTQRAFDSLKNYINNKETVLYRGKGDPNGELPAPLGSLYINENGGSNTSFYIKESEGSSSSGWTPACTVYSTTMPAGTIYAYGGTTVPTDFLLCDGSAVSRTTYAELFANIGTTWGVGDGSTTFNIPDLRGMFLRGAGTHGTQTMANGSAFDGGAVGDYVADKMQGHWHAVYYNAAHADIFGSGYYDWQSGATYTSSAGAFVKEATTDGTNGTPRTGTETKPVSYSIKYIILTKSTTLPVNVTTTSSGSTTYMVKCRNTDTTPDFMANKLQATAPIVKTILNSGANEVVGFSISDASTSAKGAVQLSSSYVGVLETVATTEKALSDGLGTKQNLNSNLTSVSGLTYASTSFVKMTGANTFTLDTNTYLTSLSGAVLTDQTTPQTVGTTGNRLAMLWATDITCTNAISGSVTGNAGTVTNATFTTALTVNTGTVTLTGNVANTSVLTIGAGAVSVSGSNTGDQTSSDFDHDSLQNTHNLTTDIDHNSIGGLNGGTAGEYYHLTSDEYDSATNVATTTATGLCPILSNNAGQFLDGTGNFSVPAGGGSSLVGTYKRLGCLDIDGSTNTVDTDYGLYTVPASTYAKNVKVYICNRNGGYTARVRLAHVDGAVGDVAVADYILFDDYLLPYETKIVELDGMVATDTLLVRSSVSLVNFEACGEELTTDVYRKRVGALDIDGATNAINTDKVVYTSDRATKVNCIICNRNSGYVAEVQLAHVNSDDIADIADEDRKFFTLDVNQSLFLELDLNMATSEIISFRSDTTNVNCLVYLAE